MKYVGSKNRISKYIAPILQKCIDNNQSQVYIEPFVGGANMIDKIKCNIKIGLDIHKELIALLTAVKLGYTPPNHISEEEYNQVRLHKEQYPDYYVGLVGFCATFGAKYFGGYARGFESDGVTPRDMSGEGIRNLMKQSPLLKDTYFHNMSYEEFNYKAMGQPLVIYCDIPYQNTTKYSTSSFDHNKFWNWARTMSTDHFVFVSEYSAPEDFISIWEKPVKVKLKPQLDTHESRTEKLFVYKYGKYFEEGE